MEIKISGRVVQVFDNSTRREKPEDTLTVVIDEEPQEGMSFLRIKIPGRLKVEKYGIVTLVGSAAGYVQGSNTYLRMLPGFKFSQGEK